MYSIRADEALTEPLVGRSRVQMLHDTQAAISYANADLHLRQPIDPNVGNIAAYTNDRHYDSRVTHSQGKRAPTVGSGSVPAAHRCTCSLRVTMKSQQLLFLDFWLFMVISCSSRSCQAAGQMKFVARGAELPITRTCFNSTTISLCWPKYH